MDNIEKPSTQWLSLVREAFAKTDGSMKAVAEALTTKVSTQATGGSIAAAFAEGLVELSAYADKNLGDSATAVDAEADAIAASRRIVRPVLQAKLQARLDALDRELTGKAVCSRCESTAESQGRRARQWGSLLGPLRLKRRYASCEKCEQGVAPAQKVLGFSDSDFTPRLEEVTTMMAATVPFGMATTLVEKLCGIEVSVKGAEEMVERRAEAVLSLDADDAKTCAPFNETGLPVSAQQRPLDTVPDSQVPKVAYLEADGVIPITREELTGKELTPAERRRIQRAKKAKARGGKGRRYRIVGREVKNAVLYDGKDCAAQSPGRGCILKKTYVSHLGNWLTFAALLWVAMLRLRFDQAKLLVILSDGADWIRSLAKWLPIETFLILDLFHVKRRIWEVAHSLYGDHSARASRWANIQCDRIDAGQVSKVIEALRFLKPARTETRKLVEELAGYFDNNRDRMDYPTYRARGLRVGSGAVESANFHVTGNRLILQGMRWSAQGAGEMAALRADLFNSRWEARTRQILAAA
jgi:hypothetical protein